MKLYINIYSSYLSWFLRMNCDSKVDKSAARHALQFLVISNSLTALREAEAGSSLSALGFAWHGTLLWSCLVHSHLGDAAVRRKSQPANIRETKIIVKQTRIVGAFWGLVKCICYMFITSKYMNTDECEVFLAFFECFFLEDQNTQGETRKSIQTAAGAWEAKISSTQNSSKSVEYR